MDLSFLWRPRHGRRALLVFGLAAASAVSGCHCGRETDEEILKERIDTTSVHLYVATKVAITKTDASPEVAEVRRQLLAMLKIIEEAVRKAAASAPPAGSAITAAAPASSATAAPSAPRIKLSAADVAKLTVRLWKIRSE